MTDPNCRNCAGCGFVGSDDDHTPWKYLEELPESAKFAIRMGIIKKLPCPKCNADAKVEPDYQAIGNKIASVYKHIEKAAELARDVLTAEELDQFDQYVNHQEAVGHIFDPTAYREAMFGDHFSQAKGRTALIRSLLRLGEKSK